MPGCVHSKIEAARYRRSILRHVVPTHIFEAISRTPPERTSKICAKNLRIQNFRNARFKVRAEIWLSRQTSERRGNQISVEEGVCGRIRPSAHRLRRDLQFDLLALKPDGQRHAELEQLQYVPLDEQRPNYGDPKFAKSYYRQQGHHEEKDG